MRWNHLFQEAVGLGFLGLLLPCAGVAAAEEDSKQEPSGTIRIEAGAAEIKGGTSASKGTLRLSGNTTFDGGTGQLIVSETRSTDNSEATDTHGKYWLGVGCQAASPALRAQLDLPKGQGLVVAEIAPDGPAAAAGIKAFDILLTAGDTPLAEPGDLVKAVDAAQDKEISLQLLRAGKQQTIVVKASTRPKKDADVIRLRPDQEAWQKWLDQMPKMPGSSGGGGGGFGGVPGGPMQFRVFNAPGMVVSGPGSGTLTVRSRVELPENTSITVTRKGKEPAKISVKQGDESWDVTEDEMDKLPEKVRALVQPMVGMQGNMMFSAKAFQMPGQARTGGGAGGGGIGPGTISGTFEQRVPSPRAKSAEGADANDADGRLEGRLEELGHRMDDLRDAIRDLRESRTRRDAPPPRPGGQE